MKPKPPCPICGDNARVKTLGGGSKNMYRYACNNTECSNNKTWQQPRPNSTLPLTVDMKQGIQKRIYTCTVCGLPKKGHRCTGSRIPETSNNTDEDDVQQHR